MASGKHLEQFVGQTRPEAGDDAEFRLAQGQLTGVGGDAARRMDLLSVIVHELGHVAGLDHLSSGVMAEQLDVGVRRMPVAVSNSLQAAPTDTAVVGAGIVASATQLPVIDWAAAFGPERVEKALQEPRSKNTLAVASGWQLDFVNHLGKTDQQRNPNAALRLHLELKSSPVAHVSNLARH